MAGEARELRHRYFVEDGQWYCETTVYCNDTQTVDRSWVKPVAEDEVPPALRPGAMDLGPVPAGTEYDHSGI